MVNYSPKTLQKTLTHLLNHAQDYAADVCFDYDLGKMWAHRALLEVRCPLAFRQKWIPELDAAQTNPDRVIVINKPVLSRAMLAVLLRFWYTAELGHMDLLSDSVSLSVASLSLTCADLKPHTVPGPANATLSDLEMEINALERQFGVPLIHRTQNISDLEQLVMDIDRMRKHHIGSDVMVNLVSEPPDNSITTSFPCHRFILASRSDYFKHMLCDAFSESSSSTVHLTEGIFTPVVLQVILQYFYTDELCIPQVSPNDLPGTDAQQALCRKAHALRVLQDVFQVADFLGSTDTIRDAVLHEISVVCHSYTCTCCDCAMLLPSVLYFADNYTSVTGSLRDTLIARFSDVLDPLFWSSKTFGILVRTEQPVIRLVEARILENINKHTAIQVIPCAYTCIANLHSMDPDQTWSCAILHVLNRTVNHAVSVVADHFEFYCGVYPVFLSCVDGIKGDFSMDAFEFLLKRIVDNSIHAGNAASIYSGIVRHLLGRHGMDRESKEYHLLTAARQGCVKYLAQHWMTVRYRGGFNALDKDTLKKLSEDLNVPIRSLTKKSLDVDFHSVFHFRSKHKSTKNTKPGSQSQLSHSRFSFRSLRGMSRESILSSKDDSMVSFSVENKFMPSGVDSSLGDPSGDTGDAVADEHVLPSRDPRERSMGSLALLDELLPLDIWRTTLPEPGSSLPLTPLIQPSSLLPNASANAGTETNLGTGPGPFDTSATSPRHPKIKFALPIAPQHVNHLPASSSSQRSKVRRSRSSLKHYRLKLSRGDDHVPVERKCPEIGTKVELLRRPLPTHGTIKFIGPVHFAKGIWVGIELEARLGSHDGTVDGIRYFQTHSQRGAFCKLDDFKIIHIPGKSC